MPLATPINDSVRGNAHKVKEVGLDACLPRALFIGTSAAVLVTQLLEVVLIRTILSAQLVAALAAAVLGFVAGAYSRSSR